MLLKISKKERNQNSSTQREVLDDVHGLDGDANVPKNGSHAKVNNFNYSGVARSSILTKVSGGLNAQDEYVAPELVFVPFVGRLKYPKRRTMLRPLTCFASDPLPPLGDSRQSYLN